MREKLCIDCRRLLPVTDFQRWGAGRHSPYCKPCTSDRRKTHASRAPRGEVAEDRPRRRPYGSLMAKVVAALAARGRMTTEEVGDACGIAKADARSVLESLARRRPDLLHRVARSTFELVAAP